MKILEEEDTDMEGTNVRGGGGRESLSMTG